MTRDVIIACDFPSGRRTLEFLEAFGPLRPFVKVGMELFYAEGPGLVRELKAREHRVFLDLKLHDIPNTVRRTMRVLAALGADMCNVHAAGTQAMMRAALEGLEEGAPAGRRPVLIAVTQLTSTTPEALRRELLIDAAMEHAVAVYARNAQQAGLDGVVCSPLEAEGVKALCGREFLTVTPGIRPEGSDAGDQARTATPAGARAAGTDYIVVGRPITQSPDPAGAYRRCMEEFL